MTFNPIYHIKDTFNSSYLTTREAAHEIVERAPEDTRFDFSGIIFASSSFADEFLSLLELQGKGIREMTINLNPELHHLFEAVARRRGSRKAARQG